MYSAKNKEPSTPNKRKNNNQNRTHTSTSRMTMASPAYSGTIHDSPWSNVGGSRKDNTNKDSEKGAAAVIDEMSPFEQRLNETTTSRAGGGNSDPHWDEAVHHANVGAFDSLSIPQQQQHFVDADNSCRMITIRCAVHIWIWTDLLFGFVWSLYGLSLLLRRASSAQEQSQPHTPVMVIALALTLATLFMTRFAAASLSLSTVMADYLVYRRAGLLVSACIAPMLSLVYVTLFGTVAVAGRGNCTQYLHQYHHVLYLPCQLTQRLLLATNNRFHGLLVVLLLLALSECIQWQVYQQYRRYLLQKDVFELEHPPAAPVTPATVRRGRHHGHGHSNRPWWWQSSSVHGDSTLTRHLLLEEGDGDYDAQGRANVNDPCHNGQPVWSLPARFRTPTRSSNTNNNNASHWWWYPWKDPNAVIGHDDHVRDDGSVDFASVQEEWASRTEEDPFWWSRPEDEHRDTDISWAKNIKDDEGGRGDASNPK
jgi:hypothetical protein